MRVQLFSELYLARIDHWSVCPYLRAVPYEDDEASVELEVPLHEQERSQVPTWLRNPIFNGMLASMWMSLRQDAPKLICGYTTAICLLIDEIDSTQAGDTVVFRYGVF